MFGFGYGLVPLYKAICEMTGINVLALGEQADAGRAAPRCLPIRRLTPAARSLWSLMPTAAALGIQAAQRSVQVHPGELTTVMYEFQNVQNRRMSAQAIPSYAPMQAAGALQQAGVLLF